MRVTLSAKVRSTYTTFTKEFKNRQHMLNYMEFMRRKGYHFIGHLECTPEAGLVQAQEDAYFDNFCKANNI